MTLGTALGATLVATVGAATTFAVNALSFLVDVVVLATIRVGPSPRVGRAPRQIRDGMYYVWQTRPLRDAMLRLAIIATLSFTVQVSVPILISDAYGGGPSLIGAGFTAVTAGSLVGTLLFAARGAATQETLRRAALAMAVALVVTAASRHEFLALLGLAGLGLSWSFLISAIVAILQAVDPTKMGRVMSLFAVVLLGGTTIGSPLATALTTVGGARAPFVVGALAAVVAAAARFLRLPRNQGPCRPGRRRCCQEQMLDDNCRLIRVRARARDTGSACCSGCWPGLLPFCSPSACWQVRPARGSI
jgi:hypothetical protein